MTPQELKNSILQLAIQGKLVEQRPEEGTAEELYKQIQAEKQSLIKAGKIKKEKPLPEITEDEMPFEIPISWKWVRLGDAIREVIVPMRDKPPFSTNGIPWCRIEDRDGLLLNGSKSHQLVSEKTIKEMNLKTLPIGTVLSACTGGSIGTIVINTVECCTNQTFNGLVCSSGLYNWFLLWFLTSKFNELRQVGTGTTIAYVSQNKSKMMVLPLPPLSEQKRIVAKIEELLPLIDRYEKAWSRLEEFNKRFPGDMQKSILQMAIQGKLVEQRPEEGTGEELYQQIQTEKQVLIKSGKIKKEKPLPEIADDEIPFDIPESWRWVRLKELTECIGDGIHGTPEFQDNGGYYFVNGNNLSNGQILFRADTQQVSQSEFQKYRKPLSLSTVLISINGTIGNIAFYNNEPIILGKSACYITLLGNIHREYIRVLLESKFFLDYAFREATQTTIKNVSLKAIRMLPVPLPPLAEQQRIVTRLEELLPLCEKLK